MLDTGHDLVYIVLLSVHSDKNHRVITRFLRNTFKVRVQAIFVQCSPCDKVDIYVRAGVCLLHHSSCANLTSLGIA